MIEPLPRFAKGFVAAVGLVVLAVLVWRLVDDGLGEARPAQWRVAPAAELDPSSREIPIIVNEDACASGRSAEGRITAEVFYDTETLRVEIGVRPFGGDQECQGNPDTPFVVELDEPLGDRTIAGERWESP